ncbi:hypothetical protein [Lutimonas vermicola]|uniref:Phenylacetate-CoA ligase n=1 Tax=Lutimonas vermicola TaxID=414288 RepID=A0ABU9L5H8_9FLAO
MNYRLFLIKIYRNFFTPAKGFKKWEKHLNKTQWLSLTELNELQEAKLKKLLLYSIKNVAIFSDIVGKMDLNWSAKEILDKFPITDKSFYRKANEKCLSKNAPTYEYHKSSTSGSTGESFYFYLDVNRQGWGEAAKYRTDTFAETMPHHSRASLWGASFDNYGNKGIKIKIRNFLTPFIFLSSYDLSIESIMRYVAILKKEKPRMLVSYPTPLIELADYCKKNNIHFPFLRSIICSSEQLFDFQRKIIEDTFVVPVFNRYGSREFGSIAQECNCHNGLHVNIERMYVEILNDKNEPCKEGEIGQLVITDLDNKVMPLIRYRIGDLAAWSNMKKCACGRGLPLLEKVEGRAFDVIRTPNGQVISGTFWTLLIRYVSHEIKSFQVVQNEIEKINIKIEMIKGRELSKEKMDILLSKIKEKDNELKVNVQFCEKIELTRSGKRRFVVSSIK